MTNNNYTSWSNQEIVDFISGLNIYNGRLSIALSHRYPKLYKELLVRTSFIDKSFPGKRIPMPERIYCVKHNLNTLPICQNPSCNKPVKWRTGINEFAKHCSCSCSMNDPANKEMHTKTNIERYGVENVFQSEHIKEKIKQKNKDKYGVEYTSQLKENREKFRETNIKLYGGVGMASNLLKEKVKTTNMNKYGVEYTTLVKEFQLKMKQSIKDKYGVDNTFQSEQIKRKIRQVMNDKYGVEYYSQSEEYHKTKRHKYHSDKYPGLTFDSTWEVKVYEFCKDNNIEVEYSPSITYKYEYDGKIWTYHPDFLINGKVYEVKGDMFFRINEFGQEEMFCPYGRKKLGEERWNWLCGLFEAKHQCMIKNNVIILRQKDMSILQTYFA